MATKAADLEDKDSQVFQLVETPDETNFQLLSTAREMHLLTDRPGPSDANVDLNYLLTISHDIEEIKDTIQTLQRQQETLKAEQALLEESTKKALEEKEKKTQRFGDIEIGETGYVILGTHGTDAASEEGQEFGNIKVHRSEAVMVGRAVGLPAEFYKTKK
ncbi:hypothetical protein ABW19_dt0205924 [Dactylella cylindrospora]|nr:hypothetical protein ABW19_dt0205924 [Dactylella cylindrospora]